MNRFTRGRIFKSRGRQYRILGTKDHWCRDGRYVEMIRYESACAEPRCKRIFTALTTKTRLRRGQLNKRCDLHHAPGVPAPAKKARPKPTKKARTEKRRLMPSAPAMTQGARERARLVRKAALAVQRGQQPSYLD